MYFIIPSSKVPILFPFLLKIPNGRHSSGSLPRFLVPPFFFAEQ
jgi:hypothetical protein